MAHEDGSKQRKSKLPMSRDARRAERKGAEPVEAVVEPTPVQTVNERQIATGTLSTTGERGADTIARVSDWMQANGKFMVAVVGIMLVLVFGVMFYTRTASGQESTFQARLIAASSETKVKDIIAAFDRIAADAERNPANAADFHYRLAVRLASVLLPSASNTVDIDKDGVARAVKAKQDYDAVADADPTKDIRGPHLAGLVARLTKHQDFYTSASSRAIENTEYKPTTPEPKIIGDDENPVAVFESTQGSFKVEFYDDGPIRNSVNTVVTLIERGFYNSVRPSLILQPGMKNLEDPLFSNASLVAFGDRGMLVDLPKEEDKGKTLTDEEKKERAKKKLQEPPFTIEPETFAMYQNTEGTLMMYYTTAQPFQRGSYLGVNLTANRQLDGKYQVIGKVTDEAGLKVLRSLLRTDRITHAYMESKRKRDYTPRVIFTKGAQASQLPTLWLEKTDPVEPIRIPKTEVVIDDTKNPLIVISTSKGDVEFELEQDMCPNTVANFMYLIAKDGYKDSPFHRILGVESSPNTREPRIAQGGRDPAKVKSAKEKTDRAKDLRDQARRSSSADASRLEADAQKLEDQAKAEIEEFGWTIKNEAFERDEYNLRNVTGTIVMARQSDPHTAGRQFYVNMRDNPDWDKKDSPYCVFGFATKNLWVFNDIRDDDKIIEIWVARKRSGDYKPEVKLNSENSYKRLD